MTLWSMGFTSVGGAWMSAPGDTVWATGSSTCGGGLLNAAGALRPASRYTQAGRSVMVVEDVVSGEDDRARPGLGFSSNPGGPSSRRRRYLCTHRSVTSSR